MTYYSPDMSGGIKDPIWDICIKDTIKKIGTPKDPIETTKRSHVFLFHICSFYVVQ